MLDQLINLVGRFVGASWKIVGKWIGRASSILGGIVLVVLGLIWLWRWVVRHEATVKQRWQVFVTYPRVVALRHRFAPQLEFLRGRLSPEGYLGLHLTVGALVLVGAAWLFGGIAEDVVHGDPLTIVDKQVAAWVHDHITPGFAAVMEIITFFGSPAVISAITLAASLLFLWRRYWYQLLALVLTTPGGMLLNLLMKSALARQRPPFENPLATLSGYSFPSGHTMMATVLYGTLAVSVVLELQAWRWRVLTILIAWLIILLVGFSRIYLGAHYLSDVLGAISLGVAWLALCLTGVDTLRRRLTLQGSGFKK